MVVPTWPAKYLGLDLPGELARVIDTELRPFNLGRLNPLGLAQAAPALFTAGSEEQRARFLPPMVRNDEKWCQLFSEPGSGSDLASLSTRAIRDGEEWVVTGQKVWTTWAHLSDFAVLIARTNPDVPKRRGITFFLCDLHAPGVDVRPLAHMGGETEFNEVFLNEVRIPDFNRVGDVDDGWNMAHLSLAGERQMVSGGGSGSFSRIGGSGAHHLFDLARQASAAGRPGGWDDPVTRQAVVRLWIEEKIRSWTNERVRAQVRSGRPAGVESSIGKIHQAELNQRMQVMATDLLGAGALAWPTDGGPYFDELPHEVRGMFRSRANTIEGGTTEINKNVLGERVLGLPREPDPYLDAPWRDVPRS
jgi:alkylation response protein AidB-like acyl-CoA dehydrogenase